MRGKSLEDAAIGSRLEDEVDGFDVGDAGDSPQSRFFAALRMTRLGLPDGVEDKGEADVGRGFFAEEFVEEGCDG